MTKSKDNLNAECHKILDIWLESCTRNRRLARNTIAVGIVVLHHIRQNATIERDAVISPGGEVSGARSGLKNILETYGIPGNFLKEVTTRQGHQDGQRLFEQYDWGDKFSILTTEEKDELLLALINKLTKHANAWLMRQNLKLAIDRRQTPSSWINLIVENAKERSGGVVEQHLIGAKLERRFKDIDVANFPAHAADRQTERAGDFNISNLVYHVTATPSRNVLQKCINNIRAGLHPILIVPRTQETKARILSQDEGIEKELTIISIEDFVAMNIIELATEESKDFFTVLKEIVRIYNKRLEEVETDLSLQIEVK